MLKIFHTLCAVSLGCAVNLRAEAPAAIGEVELLGALRLPAQLSVDGTPVGGLSGLTYDRAADRFWLLSDDRSERAQARLFRLRLSVADGRLTVDDVDFEAALALRDETGRFFARRSLDPEGVAVFDRGFFVSSEGETKAGVPPFVAEFDRRGQLLRRFDLPPRFLPGGDGLRGVRDNLGFESLSLSDDGATLFFATEGPLVGDGPAADVDTPGVVRIRRVDLTTGRAEEFFYPLDAVSTRPEPSTGFRVNGLSEMLALDRQRLMVLEREFVVGVGHRVRLFLVDLAAATEVSGLDGPPGTEVRLAKKRQVLDFKDLGIEVANYEGLAFGPRLEDGRATLVVVSDDNFREYGDDAWLLLLAVASTPPSIADVQGAAHRSPREGRHVLGLQGVVTAVDRTSRLPTAWIESSRPDARPETSEGLVLSCPAVADLVVGRLVAADGRIEERAANPALLPVTTLACNALVELGPAVLDAAPQLFDSRPVPARVTATDLRLALDPDHDALSFWESLEGMRVALGPTVVAGATKSYGEIVVLPPDSRVPRSAAGSTLVSPDAPWLRRALVSARLVGGTPQLPVGSQVEGLEGVVDYGFGNYRILTTEPLRAQVAPGRCMESTGLSNRRGHVTVASYNVENLSLAGDVSRFRRLAEDIVERMRSPNLLALQEVQDDNGPGPLGGATTSQATLDQLIREIERQGGPRYEATWIDPEADREGGQPGGNIRVVVMHDTRRVALVRRGAASARDAVTVLGRGRTTHLSLSPGRVAPESAAFDLSQTEGVRRSLIVEYRISGRPFFMLVNHWSSKFADDRLFGARQPLEKPTGRFRLAQAIEVRSLVRSILEAEPRSAIVVLGDFNDVEDSPPMRELSRRPLVSLSSRLTATDRYSFEFEGNAQLIDHVLVSPALAAGAEIDVVHLNVDCPDAVRSSDHDPLVARLRLPR